MPFFIIKGTFRLLSKTKNGAPTGFEPDGDSMQFRPDQPNLLNKLTRLKAPFRLTAIKSTQLRFEGIDALELHFTAGKGGVTHQPRPAADNARDHLVTEAGLDPVQYKAPGKIRVQPPAPHDGAKGYILSRSLEVHGRPVAFVYTGSAPGSDGSTLSLTTPLLKKSLNYEMLLAGQAYPLYYDTLFQDLRLVLDEATEKARKAKRGMWGNDRTLKGLHASTIPQLEASGFLFPKLFRRLAEYFGSGGKQLSLFPAWVAAKKERVLDLDTTNNTHFDTYIDVSGGSAKLTKAPNRLVFTSAKGAEAWV